MQLEHVILFETAFIDQHVNTLTRGVLATCMLFVDGFLTTTETSLFALGDQLFNLLYLFTHKCML